MLSLFLILFFISVPIFYILGIASFLISLFGNKSDTTKEPSRESYLAKVIKDLKNSLNSNPQMSVKELLSEYETDYQTVIGISAVNEKSTSIDAKATALQTTKTPEPSVMSADLGSVWSNWYSDNSITVLLYIGAFLIIAAASIFVGFQWETISGVVKALLLTFVAVAFFGFGLWFYSIPKIKTAGTTFIGIGALLIPVIGAAWYNFVLKDMGMSVGAVWLVTSLVSFAIYLFLAWTFDSPFYSYIASLSTLSFSFSVVNTLGIDNKYYILASAVSSFILLIGSLIAKSFPNKSDEVFITPLRLSSYILMPATLFYGFFIALSTGLLFSIEAAVTLFMGSAYYFFSYYLSRESWNIFPGELLLPFGVILYAHATDFSIPLMLAIVGCIGAVYIAVAYQFLSEGKHEEADISLWVGTVFLILPSVDSYIRHLNHYLTLFFAVLPIVGGAAISYIKKNLSFLGLSFLFLGFATFIVHYDILQFTQHPEYLAWAYVVYALVNYAILYYFRSRKEELSVFVIAATAFFLVGMFLVITHSLSLALMSLIVSVVILHASSVFEEPSLGYLSMVFLYFGVWNILHFMNIDQVYYIYIFEALSYGIYFVHLVAPDDMKTMFRQSGLVASLLGPLFGLGESTYLGYHTYERDALVTAYLTTGLYGLDTVINNTPNFGYITSALAMGTFLWQIHFLGVTEVLAYTIPLGIYFLVLSYFQTAKGNKSNADGLNFVGILFLLAPPTVLSLADNPIKYSVTLAVLGIVLLLVGIQNGNKLYRYSGIFGIVFAVISQTYQYLFQLPRWVVVGAGGIIFIAVALYLLLNRTEEKTR